MAIWIKPSGMELEVSETKESIAAAKAAGWEKKGEKKETKKKKTK